MGEPADPSVPDISVVVPVRDEAGNLLPLLAEIEAALSPTLRFEAVFVDDRSSDDSLRILQEHARTHPWLVVVRHLNHCGQSTAVRTGVREARAPLVVTLDGDGQNDPIDIPALLARWRQLQAQGVPGPVLVVGWRVQRQDRWVRRVASRIANGVCSALLGGGTPDAGCGLKVFGREDFLALPYFDHMHRFLPALAHSAGGTVESVRVGHRPRGAGRSHYGIGSRLWTGLADVAGVLWLQRRARRPLVERL